MVVMALLQAAPESVQLALRYERTRVDTGEIWRLVTGHFVHLGWRHLALNFAGLALGTWLFGADRPPRYWLLATMFAALSCGLGLWLLSPDVGWCVGLSGILHGLMVVGFGGWALAGEKAAWGLVAVVALKLWWEQTGGDMPWAESMAGGRVVTDAHLWGALGGLLYLAAETAWSRLRARV